MVTLKALLFSQILISYSQYLVFSQPNNEQKHTMLEARGRETWPGVCYFTAFEFGKVKNNVGQCEMVCFCGFEQSGIKFSVRSVTGV